MHKENAESIQFGSKDQSGYIIILKVHSLVIN